MQWCSRYISLYTQTSQHVTRKKTLLSNFLSYITLIAKKYFWWRHEERPNTLMTFSFSCWPSCWKSHQFSIFTIWKKAHPILERKVFNWLRTKCVTFVSVKVWMNLNIIWWSDLDFLGRAILNCWRKILIDAGEVNVAWCHLIVAHKFTCVI